MNTSTARVQLLLSLIVSVLLAGCQGTGNTVNFDPRALVVSHSNSATVQGEDLTILVEPFQDTRPQQQRLGSRTHLWGGVTHFDAWNGQISEGMANLAVKYLQQRQWQASQGVSDPKNGNGPHDVTLTGTILSLNANAKSGFGFTDITVDMRVRFEAKNAVDGSTVRMVLGANGSDTVATFAPKDVERLLNLVAKDLYQQLFQDLGVKNKAFHLKPGLRP